MTRLPVANRELIRAINRSSVLNLVKTHGPLSRTGVARLSGLSPATVTDIVAELIGERLVYEKEPGDSTGGRRPILLAINHTARYAIGIKLMEQQIIAALTDLSATVLAGITQPLEDGQSLDRAVQALAAAVETLVEQAGAERQKLVGVGVGLAGVVDSARGVCRYSPVFSWRNAPLRDLLQARIGIPVYLDNDVNTLTLAERLFGAGQGVDDFLVVTVGRGVGMGIVVHGQPYRGTRGGGGEFGHTVLDPNGPLCGCGKRGCLEAYVSDPAILRMAREALARGEIALGAQDLTAPRLVELACAGNQPLQSVFRQAGQMLGLGIANLIDVFSPRLIIITGEGVRAGDLLFRPMRESIHRHAFADLADDAAIVIQEWGDDAWARGAASLVLQEFFRSPIEGGVGIPQGLA